MKKKRILIVDDVSENIDILVANLKDEYDLSIAKEGEKAIEVATDILPDMILLDIMMPGMDGYEVCKILKQNEKTKNIPIIFITALSQDEDEEKGLLLGAVDYITKPFEPSLLKARVKTHIELKEHRDHLQKMVDDQTVEIKKTRDAVLAGMAFLAEFRDPETGAHVQRTKEYVRVLMDAVKFEFPELTPEKCEAIYQAAALHDIGKVGVPDAILFKPGDLTPMEFEEIKNHTIYGRQVFEKTEKLLGSTNTFMSTAKEIANYHHEKWDGSGYPEGLSGEDIPLSARLITVGDIYDALVSERPYKNAFEHEKAVDIITNGDKKVNPAHFDPRILKAFKENNLRFRDIALKYQDKD